MPTIVELIQDRNLLCSDFSGYKLSLDSLPIFRQNLLVSPEKREPNQNQYSLLHAELFSIQNLLVVDPWERTISYYVNRLGEIIRCAYDETSGRNFPNTSVFKLGSGLISCEPGDYNISFIFLSEKFCLLCDGKDALLLLDTGNRRKNAEWKEIARTKIVIENEETACGFRIYDSRLDTIQEQKQISIALGKVKRIDSDDGSSSSHFMQIHWCKWIHEDTWKFNILDTIEGKGSIYYCAFEPRAESLVISSNRNFQFLSQKSIEPNKEPINSEKPQLHDNDVEFNWSQTDDDIVIKFNANERNDRNNYNIKCTSDKLTVKYIEEVLLESELFEKIDLDLTTWTMENDFLQITLVKENSSLYWPSLLKNGNGPKETQDNNSETCNIPMEQKPIANLEAPIEDCDFPMGTTDDEIAIDRFNLAEKSVTHSIQLGAIPPLFTTNLRPGFPNALATRQGEDACIWLQQYNPNRPNQWSLRHEGTLDAFAYVQASKQQKKFIDCSPDFNYALICESHRHIFLYKSRYDTAGGLRKRFGPSNTIGKQHLISLEDVGEILGCATAPNVITLLTEKCVLHIQINS